MNTSQPPDTPTKANKLIIRSEVMAVIRHLASLGDPPKQERLKQLRRLQELNQPEAVQDIFVKELQRATSFETIQIITEFLMDLGDINYLQDKLWGVIRDSKTSDEIKDVANLILRHLATTVIPISIFSIWKTLKGLLTEKQ